MGAYGGFSQKPQLALSNVSWAHRLHVPMTADLRTRIRERAVAGQKEMVKKSISKSSGTVHVILSLNIGKCSGFVSKIHFITSQDLYWLDLLKKIFFVVGLKSKEWWKRSQKLASLPFTFWCGSCKASHRVAVGNLFAGNGQNQDVQ